MGEGDQKEIYDTKIDYWLISLKQIFKNSLKNHTLPKNVFPAVIEFYGEKFRWDAMSVRKLEEFRMLKPRLQPQVLDFLFQNYYKIFKIAFENTELRFKREIISNSEFVTHQFYESIDEKRKMNYFELKETPII